MFPPRTEDEKYIMLPFFWVPKDTIPLRVRGHLSHMTSGTSRDYLQATEGNVIDYNFIEAFINKLYEKYTSKRLQLIDGTQHSSSRT
jgi:hypothetical protein